MFWQNLFFAVLSCACFVGVRGAEFDFTVLDFDTGKPLPCRIHMKDAAGKPIRPKGLPFWHDHFVCAGVAELDLAPGTYPYEIDRGPEYLLTTGALSVAESGGNNVTNRLRRLVDLTKENWWPGELHVHRPPADIELLMQAEDLHVAPVITWWNNQNAWANRLPPTNPVVRFDGDRFYHLMGGEDERGGGALLYFNLSRPLDIVGAKREYPSPMTFLAEARQRPGAWVDIEKPFWYDTPVWLASGMVNSIGIGEFGYGKWWEGLKAGRVFVSNGPLLRCRANGESPGYTFKAPAGTTLDLRVDAALE